jgi:hypothetical protein
VRVSLRMWPPGRQDGNITPSLHPYITQSIDQALNQPVNPSTKPNQSIKPIKTYQRK